MKRFIPVSIALLLAGVLSLALNGCASMYTSKTKASYTPGGAIQYESDKEYQGLEVEYEMDAAGKVKKIHIRVEKSGTNESAIAAALQSNLKMTELLGTLIQQGVTKAPFATRP